MQKTMLALAILLAGASSVLAGGQTINSRVINENDYKPRQRFVCVVPARDSAQDKSPSVCRAPEGRVGGQCRCDGVVGNGTLRTAG